MNTTQPSPIQAIAEVASVHDDDRIFEMIAALESKTDRAAHERLILTALFEVIESRHDVDDAMNAWADDLDTTLTYGQALAKAVGR